jgi:hypothetical protein
MGFATSGMFVVEADDARSTIAPMLDGTNATGVALGQNGEVDSRAATCEASARLRRAWRGQQAAVRSGGKTSAAVGVVAASANGTMADGASAGRGGGVAGTPGHPVHDLPEGAPN